VGDLYQWMICVSDFYPILQMYHSCGVIVHHTTAECLSFLWEDLQIARMMKSFGEKKAKYTAASQMALAFSCI